MNEPVSEEENKRLNNPFASLKYKNYRYYWIGMCVSLIGTWMQNIAQPWLAYSLTKSPLLLSLVGTMQFTPVLLFSLFAGVIIDRFPKKKILLFTQSASLVITMILSILVFSGQIRYWHILVLATLLGTVNTLDMPTRQSFVLQLVEKKSLMNAIALNSMSFNLARIIGPVVAGIIMGIWGVGSCFLINSISFATVIISLFFIKPLTEEKREESPHTESRILKDIMDGLKYIKGNRTVLSTLVVLGVVGTFAPNFNVLVPVFTKEILKLNETFFGLIMSMLGMGSFMGAMYIAMRSKAGPKKKILLLVPSLIGAFLILTGFTNYYLVTGMTLALTGFFFIMFSSNANTTIQMSTDGTYRGRVMSVYTLVFAGSTPVGNLFAGFFSERFSARMGFWACGASILILMIPIILYNKKRRRKVESA